jgi:glutathione S-transferase
LTAKFEGADAEFAEVAMPTSEEYRSKFPLGRVPAFEQGDVLLTETVAIATVSSRLEKRPRARLAEHQP